MIKEWPSGAGILAYTPRKGSKGFSAVGGVESFEWLVVWFPEDEENWRGVGGNSSTEVGKWLEDNLPNALGHNGNPNA